MHDALALPEVVGAILEQLHATHGPSGLYPCLTVNRLFFTEGIRILWGFCGGFCPCIYTRKHCSFMEMYDEHPSRAQFYANLIQELQFDSDLLNSWQYESDSEIESPVELPLGVDFPQLKEVCFADPRIGYNQIQRFLKPSLRELTIRSFKKSQSSDSLLQWITMKCPSLTSLTITLCSTACFTEFSEKAMLDMITKSASLKSLHFRLHDDNTIWTTPIFLAISQHPKLEELGFSGVGFPDADDMIEHLRTTKKKAKKITLFPNLKSFSASIPYVICQDLFPYIRHMTELTLNDSEFPGDTDFRQVLRTIASTFSALTSLSVVMSHQKKFLIGQDIALISRNCKQITFIYLSAFFMGQSRVARDINDDLIKEIASNLPKLSSLTLDIQNLNALSIKSLHHVVTKCKTLKFLHLYASYIGWKDLGGLTNLKHSRLETAIFEGTKLPRAEGAPTRRSGPQMSVRDAAVAFTSCFPNLKRIRLDEGTGTNHATFMTEVQTVVKARAASKGSHWAFMHT